MSESTLGNPRVDIGELGKRLVEDLSTVLSSPQSDPLKTVLFIGIALALIGMLILAGFLVYQGNKQKRFKHVQKLRLKRERNPKETVISIAVVGGLFLLSLLLGFNYINRPTICNSCHGDLKIKTLKAELSPTHQDLVCLACHQEPGIGGFVKEKVDYARWTIAYLIGDYPKPIEATVPNKTCLKCHGEIARKTIVSYDIKVSHKEFLDKGAVCTDCHIELPHKTNGRQDRMTMEKCVSCHNAQNQSSACTLCHQNDTTAKLRKSKRDFAKIDLKPLTSCRGCHEKAVWDRCIKCHGVEMPHQKEFIDGGHARLAFAQKEVCFRCHKDFNTMRPEFIVHQTPNGAIYRSDGQKVKYMCNRCHMFPGPHGDDKDWIKRHGPAAEKRITVKTQLCAQEECHGDDDPVRNCSGCHSSTFCDRCHTGKSEVNPIRRLGSPRPGKR